MRQMPLTDDDVFERQQIRKLAAKEEPTAVAVLPSAPCYGACEHGQWPRTDDRFGPCGQLGVR